MSDEIKVFLDDVFSYEDVVPMTRQECAANIQYWREGGIEVPEKLRTEDLFCYLNERIEAAKKAKNPVKLYDVHISQLMTASFLIEAHDQDEAETIFNEWSETVDGCCKIRERLDRSMEGWDVDGLPCEYKWDETPDVPFEDGEKLLR